MENDDVDMHAADTSEVLINALSLFNFNSPHSPNFVGSNLFGAAAVQSLTLICVPLTMSIELGAGIG